MADDEFRTVTFPYRVERGSEEEQPFVVAFERGGGHTGGDRLTRDEFEEVLEDYDAVIVHRKKGDHPSGADRFLLYGEAEQALDADTHIDTVTARTRSHEISGEFRWFLHGKDLAVDTTIGLHCLSEDVWSELP